MNYFFFIFQRSTFNLEKRAKALVKRLFHPIKLTAFTYYRIFLNYVYLKDIYITMKIN